jgi:hypothetical protein
VSEQLLPLPIIKQLIEGLIWKTQALQPAFCPLASPDPIIGSLFGERFPFPETLA